MDEICEMLVDSGIPFLRLGSEYSCDERFRRKAKWQKLIHELRLMQCYLMPDETALRELSESVIEKLKLLTDAEFAELEFPLD